MNKKLLEHPEHVTQSINLIMDSIALKLTDSQREAAEQFIAVNVLDNGINKPVIITDNEARVSILNGDADFLYDRASGLVFFHLEAWHVFVAASLQAVHTQKHESIREFSKHNRSHHVRSAMADQYIQQDRGLIFSSVMKSMGKRKLTLSESFTLTREEKIIFTDYNFDYI